MLQRKKIFFIQTREIIQVYKIEPLIIMGANISMGTSCHFIKAALSMKYDVSLEMYKCMDYNLVNDFLRLHGFWTTDQDK